MRLRESPLYVRQRAGDKPPHFGGEQIRCGFGSLHFTSGKNGGQAPALRRSTNTMRLRESPLYVRQGAGDKPPRYGGVQIRCGFGSLHSTSSKNGGQTPALRRSTNTMRLRESPLYVRQGAGDKPPRYIRIRPHCLGAGHALLTPSTPLRYPTPAPRSSYSLPRWLWAWSGSGRARS